MHSGEWQICLLLRIAYRDVKEMQLPITDQKIIEAIIPQKKPFVMVDGLNSFGHAFLQSTFTLPEEHIFLEGEVFEAAGVVEHQAQSVALHTGYHYYLRNEEAPVGYIGAIKYLEIDVLPKKGDILITDIKILNEMMGVTLVEIVTKLHDKVIARSEMKTVLK